MEQNKTPLKEIDFQELEQIVEDYAFQAYVSTQHPVSKNRKLRQHPKHILIELSQIMDDKDLNKHLRRVKKNDHH